MKPVIQKVSKITEIAGEVVSITQEEDRRYTVTVKNDLEEKSYLTEYGQQLRVKEGDTLNKGSHY